nr:pentapeptide repeat-containing protein [Leifsonia sp. AG29]
MQAPDLQAPDLRADCSRCVGLCCVALAFARSADFAIDKPAGDPCVNLADDFRCTIHPVLRDSGFKGCTVFDCFGAGQQVTQHTFGGATWHDEQVRPDMFAVFPVMRQLHEVLWYLAEALELVEASPLHPRLRRAEREVREAAAAPPEALRELDVEALRAPAAALLRDAARLTREAGPIGTGNLRVSRTRLRPGADLAGADLRGADLRGAELRGALLIGADLRKADLSRAELIGADLRDADLAGADLSRAVYLTQMQVNAAAGSTTTRLPERLQRPAHWR